jgi:hypothetical protein
LLPSERFVFEFIMAVLFYALYFAMQFVCTLPKALGLTAVSEAERYDFKNYGCSKMYGNVQNEQFPRRHFYVPFGEFVHLHMQYYLFANSILKHPACQFFTSARKPTVNLYNTVYPLRSIQAFTSIISSEWNTMIGMPVSRLKERYR